MTAEPVAAVRTLPCWTQGFVEWLKNAPAPELFRQWAAICGVSGTLERKCWINASGGRIYPNLFVLLVAPPGIGKDQAIIPLRELWAEAGVVNLAPMSMTHKGMIDELAGITDGVSSAHKQYFESGVYVNYHTITVAVPEFGVLCPAHDLAFLSALNDLYNCGKLFDERLRGQSRRLEIENPHISILAGTQPQFLNAIFPEAAYGMGFTSRVIMAYHDTIHRVPVFGTSFAGDSATRSKLVADLRSIAQMRGPFKVSEEVREAIEHWHMHEAETTAPKHSRLLHYNTRRILHVIKICMAFAAGRGRHELIIQDFRDTLNLLYKTEYRMPEIFRAMQGRGQQAIIEEAFNYLTSDYFKTKKPMPSQRLHAFLAVRLPSYAVDQTIKVMLDAGVIKQVNLQNPNLPTLPGPQGYIPLEFTLVE